ncbi:cytochrome b/b6 domain-containing protein [Nocardioides dongkuii]|uniref:cytochrome b/b6 domain-containing protein n=1 Tax=Nocardioides dongkuii TaxID=2760089 RepID=UPI0015FD1736|nr:cytochrome b/b6 domain-containing protein [Nocardioides dongkuii]
MPLLNGPYGYGGVTKSLHWLTVLLLVAQVVVGYTMDADDSGQGRGRGRGRGGDSGRGRGRGRGGEDDGLGLFDGPLDLVDLHVVLGLALVALALTRIVWRARTPLPPWDERLTDRDKRLVTATERTLLGLLVLVPATGVALVLGGDDLLWLHVAGHVALYATVAVHVAVVLRRGLVGRMLPGGRARVRTP